MRIAQIVSEKFPVPPVYGGAIQGIVYEYSLLLKDKFHITIFSRPCNEQKEDTLSYEPIPISALERFFTSIYRNGTLSKVILMKAAFKYGVVYSYIYRCGLKIRNSYDILHIHNNPLFVNILSRAAKSSAIILHMNNPHFTSAKYMKYLRRLYKKSVEKSDVIICASKYIEDDIRSAYENADGKCITIYNGIDLNEFYLRSEELNKQTLLKYGLDPHKKLILFVGRIVKEKGVHTLIDALKIMKQSNFQVAIAGASNFKASVPLTPYERGIYEKAKELKGLIRFLGHVDRKEIAFLFSAADLCVMPSEPHQEACPLVLLEAMACSKCVVASNTGPYPEIIKNGYSGLLFEVNNPLALAYTLEFALKEDTLREWIGSNARNVAEEKFSIEDMAKKLEDVYLNLKNRTKVKTN